MFDGFDRRIHYLRISVTDRCNLRCRYCMPEEGIRLVDSSRILSYETITEVVKTAATMGFDKIRLTGGEPLVRKGIRNLVAMIHRIHGIRDLAMTTNGTRLTPMAGDLKQAGLHRVNVSLDTLDPERYRHLTRGGELRDVLAGIKAAQKAGLTPVKLNTVIRNSPQEPDARAVADFARKNQLEVRFIRQMDLEKGTFWQVIGGVGGHCQSCNRLRLSSDGFIYPCLFSNRKYSIRELGIREALLQGIQHKPESGHCCTSNTFYGFGG